MKQLTEEEFNKKVEDVIKQLQEKEEQERLIIMKGIKCLQERNEK